MNWEGIQEQLQEVLDKIQGCYLEGTGNTTIVQGEKINRTRGTTPVL